MQEISGQQLSEQRYLQRLEEEEFGESKLSKVDWQSLQNKLTKLTMADRDGKFETINDSLNDYHSRI